MGQWYPLEIPLQKDWIGAAMAFIDHDGGRPESES